MEVRGDGGAPRYVVVDVGQCHQSRGGAVGLADCDGPVEADDLRVGEPEELVVPLDDLDPIGLLDRGASAWSAAIAACAWYSPS